MKVKNICWLIALLAFANGSAAQPLNQTKVYSRADYLRGSLTAFRNCYDINYYHLDIKINIDEKFISGSNLFRFTATQDFRRLQFDLFANLDIQKVVYKNKELDFKREFNAVFIDFPQTIMKGSKDEFTVFYSGKPIVAKRAPWDGGFVFSTDQSGKPWVATACQGMGASVWWPNKDHQADEVDSMDISVSVPAGLMDISNGRLKSSKILDDGYTQYNWFVSSPINNYNVSLNIADYAHFSDNYTGENGKLSLDYYVLKENLEKAKIQFEADVKPMFRCFEKWFGPYPFYRDGYKLIETPHLGMEHQSAVAYGNQYMKGYLGRDLSGTGLGLKWDFIIIHETAHEWWGNNITSKDIADMWIHEGFATYAEGLYVEQLEGKQAGVNYIKGLRKNVGNKTPITGPYNVNQEGSGDMYQKGANMLQSIRTIINDDTKWRNILRGLNKDFNLKTVTADEIVNYITSRSGKDLKKIFDQYLHYAGIPVLETKKNAGNSVSYRWQADATGFNMPLRMKLAPSQNWKFIQPTSEWKTIQLKNKTDSVIIDTDNFYITIKNL